MSYDQIHALIQSEQSMLSKVTVACLQSNRKQCTDGVGEVTWAEVEFKLPQNKPMSLSWDKQKFTDDKLLLVKLLLSIKGVTIDCDVIKDDVILPYETKFWREKILANQPSAIIGG